MSGIVGMVRFDDAVPDQARAGRMLRAVAHRGPEGEHLTVHGRCVMGLARLSILDRASGERAMHLPGDPDSAPTLPESEPVSVRSGRAVHDVREAAQPQTGTLGSLHLVFNGEIYNHRYLRSILQRRGHTFQSDHSDAEVLLVGYREWGEALPKHLQGMFAFAIWDEGGEGGEGGESVLFLARDRFGKKPLFVKREPGGVSFASLAGALAEGNPISPLPSEGEGPGVRDLDSATGEVLASPDSQSKSPHPNPLPQKGEGTGTTAAVDPEALGIYLRLGYPLRRSLVAGVEELEPAHWLRFGGGGERGGRYWRPPPVSRHSSSMGAAEALEEVLREAVAARLEADVPLGVVLTGGVGSTLIAALASGELTKAGRRLATFSVAGGVALGEPPPAGDPVRIAEHLDTDHTQLELHDLEDGERAVMDLERLVALAGEPLADPRALLWYRAFQKMRERVTVALTGDGGDEVFAYHPRYRLMRQSRSPMGAMSSQLARLLRGGKDPAAAYAAAVEVFDPAGLRRLRLGEGVADEADEALLPGWGAVMAAEDGRGPAEAALRWDLQHEVSFGVLRRADRTSMAAAVEVRCPLLDTPVVDLAGHLPLSVLMPRGKSAGLLWEVARRVAPEAVKVLGMKSRRTGDAAGDRLATLLRTSWREPVEARLLDGRLTALGLNGEEVERLWREHIGGAADHERRVWALLALGVWRGEGRSTGVRKS